MNNQYLPAPAYRVSRLVRGLTGDMKIVAPGSSSMLVDVEYDAPLALLVTGFADQAVVWHLNSGLDRTPLPAAEYGPALFYNRVVVARSIQLLATLGAGVEAPFALARAAVVPVELSADAAVVSGLTSRRTVAAPTDIRHLVIPESVVSVEVDSLIPSGEILIYGAGQRSGVSVYNTATVDAFVLLRGVIASPTNFSVKIPPRGYFETPFGYRGRVSIVWAAGPGTGTAQVSVFAFDEDAP